MSLRRKKILVTGAAGFIGYHVSKLLLEKDCIVVGLDNINNYYDVNLKFSRLEELGISKTDLRDNSTCKSSKYNNFYFLKQNLEDKEQLNDLFNRQTFDYVCHLAAQAGVRYSLENPYAYIESNIIGFINILECCRQHEIKHLVYASSSSVYGMNNKVPFSENDQVDKPVSLYAATKKSNELMAYTYSHLYKIPSTGLRFFTVYGPWGRPDMAPILFANAICSDQEIKVFNNGDLMRDFTYIDDIAEGVCKVLDNIPLETNKSSNYRILNIGNSKPVSLMDFIKTLENTLGKKAKLKMHPMQPGDVKITYADTTLLQDIIGYKPIVELKDGINNFITWYNAFNKKHPSKL